MTRTRVLVMPRHVISLAERPAGTKRSGYVEPEIFLTLLLRGRNRTTAAGEVVEVRAPVAARAQGAVLDLETLEDSAELCVVLRSLDALERVHVARRIAERIVDGPTGLLIDHTHEKET